jgi:hypothetical protein
MISARHRFDDDIASWLDTRTGQPVFEHGDRVVFEVAAYVVVVVVLVLCRGFSSMFVMLAWM